MKVAIAGAGAMGYRFAVMLSEAQVQVTLIDQWDAHVKKINQVGLQMEVEHGIRQYHLPTFFPEQVTGHFDLIIIFTKAMQMEEMLRKITPVINEHTTLLCLSNGFGNEDILKQFVAAKQILIGVTLWSSELLGPGKIRATGTGRIDFQAASADCDKIRLTAVLNLLNQAGLNANLAVNVHESIWRKAGFNSVINPLSALLNCNVAEFGKLECATQLTDLILEEISTVADAEGVPFSVTTIKQMLEPQFDPQASGKHYPSMHQDLSKHRLTEIDFLNGYVVKLGRKHQLATPVNQMITGLIHRKEQLGQTDK